MANKIETTVNFISRSTRNVTKSKRAPLWVDASIRHGSSTGKNWTHWHQYLEHSSIHKIPKVKVTTPRSKVTGPNIHADAHLPAMGSLPEYLGHSGVHKKMWMDRQMERQSDYYRVPAFLCRALMTAK